MDSDDQQKRKTFKGRQKPPGYGREGTDSQKQQKPSPSSKQLPPLRTGGGGGGGEIRATFGSTLPQLKKPPGYGREGIGSRSQQKPSLPSRKPSFKPPAPRLLPSLPTGSGGGGGGTKQGKSLPLEVRKLTTSHLTSGKVQQPLGEKRRTRTPVIYCDQSQGEEDQKKIKKRRKSKESKSDSDSDYQG